VIFGPLTRWEMAMKAGLLCLIAFVVVPHTVFEHVAADHANGPGYTVCPICLSVLAVALSMRRVAARTRLTPTFLPPPLRMVVVRPVPLTKLRRRGPPIRIG